MAYTAHATVKPTIERRRTCNKCGRLGHLTNNCINQDKHHDMIGIEIEGWFHDLTAMQVKAKELTGGVGLLDGSLREVARCTGDDNNDGYEDNDEGAFEDCDNENCDTCPHPTDRRLNIKCSAGRPKCRVCGARGWEFQTKPGSVGEALKQLTQLYPDVTSRRAGMHIHMSFKEPTSVALLCSEAFFKHWTEKWTKWGTKNNIQGAFWERLREGNDNTYSKPNNMGEWKAKDLVTGQAAHGGHEARYRAINFLSWNEHKTVEFRMLPMFQKGNLATAAVEHLVDIVESFLQKVAFDTDISAPPTTISKDASKPVELEPVNLDFDVPFSAIPEVKEEINILGEVDLVTAPVSPGAIRVFRWQLDEVLTQLATSATDKKNSLANPKQNKVNWVDFDPNPVTPTTTKKVGR